MQSNVFGIQTEWATVEGPSGAMATLTLTLGAPALIGRDSSPALRSDLRRSILAAIDGAGRGGPDFVLILRTQSDGHTLLRIDPEIGEADARGVAETVVESMVELYRALLTRRVLAFLFVGLDLRDAQLFRAASGKVGAELGREAGSAPGSDAWLVERFALFTSMDSHKSLEGMLSSLSSVLSRRGERARKATGEFTLPPGGIPAPTSIGPKSNR